MEPRTSRNANCAIVLCLSLAHLVAKSVTQNFAIVLCLSLPHLVATSVTQIFAIVLCLSLPHLVAKSGTQFFAANLEYILGGFLPSESSRTCLLKSTMHKMPKGLTGPTFFEVQAPRVRLQRLVLPPWTGQKRVGGGGPPRGVTIESAVIRLTDVQACGVLRAKFQAKGC